MNFNKKEFENFNNDVIESLKLIEKKYNVNIERGNIIYSDFDFTINFKVSKADIDAKRLAFEKDCRMYDFSPSDYNKQFRSDGKTFRLVGFNSRSTKYYCLAKCIEDNNMYKFTGISVKEALKRK